MNTNELPAQAPERIWTCKIGGPAPRFQSGADLPMRDAVRDAFANLTGADPEFIFSGWGGELTEPERAVVDNREPSAEFEAKWLSDRERQAGEAVAQDQEAAELLTWFSEAKGFSQGTKAPHKWVLRAEQAIRRLASPPAPQEAQAVPPGFALVSVEQLTHWKQRVNTLASLSLKAERHEVGACLKTEIADVVADPLNIAEDLAAPVAQPATEQAEAPSDFINKTNREYAAWCATHYNPEALDERGMVSLHGLWAWQEQERRKLATQPTASNAGEREAWPIQRFNLDANIDGVDQLREFVLASDHERIVHDLETNCDPAGMVRENAQLRDSIEGLQIMYRAALASKPAEPVAPPEREALQDLLYAYHARPSCQEGASHITRCRCISCATERASAALSATTPAPAGQKS